MFNTFSVLKLFDDDIGAIVMTTKRTFTDQPSMLQHSTDSKLNCRGFSEQLYRCSFSSLASHGSSSPIMDPVNENQAIIFIGCETSQQYYNRVRHYQIENAT